MLDIYADGLLLRMVFKASEKNMRDLRSSKILEFLRNSCNLYVNETISKNRATDPFYLQLFIEGRGNSHFAKIPFNRNTFSEAKPWSVFMLENKNANKELVENDYLVCFENDAYEIISSLLFTKDNQRDTFRIISYDELTSHPLTSRLLFFEGWKSIDNENILPLSDVVLIDKHLLYKSYPLDNCEAFIQKSFLPLIEVLIRKLKSGSLNLTIFTEFNSKCSFSPTDFYERVLEIIEERSLHVFLSIAFCARLGSHERYIYTNYLGIDPKLPISSFQYNIVTGKKDKFKLYPYAVQIFQHESDLSALAELGDEIREQKYSIIGNLKNRLLGF